tara:strand:- start:167 stop:325 length:159 start_codon:yes stop_codon:yes gene_type:complete
MATKNEDAANDTLWRRLLVALSCCGADEQGRKIDGTRQTIRAQSGVPMHEFQ